jgi:hypothetical protein
MSSKAECEVMFMCIEELAGMSTTVKGYDGFVEVTRKVMQTRSPLMQRASSMRVLHSAIPQWLLKIVTKIISPPDSPCMYMYSNVFPARRDMLHHVISLHTCCTTEY